MGNVAAVGAPRITAGDLARALVAGGIEALCREILPQGSRRGNEWVAPSLSGTSARALSVHLSGTKAGVFADFSSDARGDAFDLVAHVLFRGDKRLAYRWALVRTGLGQGHAPARLASAPRRPADGPDEDERATRAAALRLWLGAQPCLRDTPADLYLRARGIELAELGRQPGALRYHPACKCVEIDAELPALLAAITSPSGEHVATHRTFLAQDESGTWRKAKLRAPKKSLGRYVGGAIRLWRGASGRRLADAPETDTVVIAEGIENALSVVMADPRYRVLAAVSLANLARIVLPANVVDVIVAADNDFGNVSAEATLQRAVDRLLSEGRSVRVARSSVGKDLNANLVHPE